MSLVAKDSDNGFTPVPPGMHLARCYRIVDLGTQRSEFQGVIKNQRKVMLQFEVHGEDDAGNAIVTQKGEPMSISKNFTLSLADRATLRTDLQTWRGKEFTADELRGFELKNVLGAWAMLNISKSLGKDNKEYTNIATINSVPKQLRATLPVSSNKIAMFTIDDPDMVMFETFSKTLKGKIEASPEWQSRSYQQEQNDSANSGTAFDDMDSDIPF